MLVAGCDIGSTTGKAVIMDGNKNTLAMALIPSTFDPQKTANDVLEKVLREVEGISKIEELDYIIGTGYGRIEIDFANENISEITCHSVGAHHLNPKIRTVLDIGGQDCKAIRLRDNGKVLEFAMNNKCAAGTGRFLESISRAFNMDLQSFSDLSLKSDNPFPISSQCSVFAESEVVSLVSQRKLPEDIAAGVQESVAKRLVALLRKVGLKECLTVTGGCAKNKGLIKTLKEHVDIKIVSLPEDPQLVGAIGAAVLAAKNIPCA